MNNCTHLLWVSDVPPQMHSRMDKGIPSLGIFKSLAILVHMRSSFNYLRIFCCFGMCRFNHHFEDVD